METLIQVKEQLERRGFQAQVFETAAQAKEYILSAIQPGQTAGSGGSATLMSMEMDKALAEKGITFYNHWYSPTPEDKRRNLVAACTADVYLSSVNAVTMDGRLINIDGHGNRVAATLYGPGRVIFVVGKNKLAQDYESAIERIKTVACPANARRLGRKTPCATLGYCTDCRTPQRMCSSTVVMEYCMSCHPMEVLLVNEELGY